MTVSVWFYVLLIFAFPGIILNFSDDKKTWGRKVFQHSRGYTFSVAFFMLKHNSSKFNTAFELQPSLYLL